MLVYAASAALLVPGYHVARIQKLAEPAVLADAVDSFVAERRILRSQAMLHQPAAHGVEREHVEPYECASASGTFAQGYFLLCRSLGMSMKFETFPSFFGPGARCLVAVSLL